MCLRSILRALTIRTLSLLAIASPTAFAAETYMPLQGGATAGHFQPLVGYPAAGDFGVESPVKIHEVANWVSMAEALSTMPTGLYAGVELYYARPRIGESGTFATGVPSNNGGEFSLANFSFDYQASPRAYLGWRSIDTGDAVQFGYWNFNDTAAQSFAITDPGRQVFVPLIGFDGSEPLFNPGDNIQARRTLNVNIYDIDYLKSLAFVGGRWLVTGSVGARIADIDQQVYTEFGSGNGIQIGSYGKELSFFGAGPRLTIEGRRNIGSFFSLYARGGYSLLLGGFQAATFFDSEFSDGNGTYRNQVFVRNNLDRTVSVTEIELGASWAPFENLILTGGYLFQAWSGLNSSIGDSVAVTGGDFIGFDGFIIRGVLCY